MQGSGFDSCLYWKLGGCRMTESESHLSCACLPPCSDLFVLWVWACSCVNLGS